MFFHFLIPLPHGQGHFALAHKCANHLIAGIQIFLHAQQNVLKIRSTSAKSGGTKQKIFLFFTVFNNSKVAASAVPLSVQKPTNNTGDDGTRPW